MGQLDKELALHHSVGLDTCVFIYHFEHHPSYLSLTEELLSNIENGYWHAVVSMLAIMEVTVRPWQLERADVAVIY